MGSRKDVFGKKCSVVGAWVHTEKYTGTESARFVHYVDYKEPAENL